MANTFAYCTSLITAPKIPEGITNMYYAFYGCTNMNTYNGSTDSEGDFSSYIIPDSVTSMSYTFQNCSSLKISPVIPESVIGLAGTFWGCSSLTTAPVLPSKTGTIWRMFEGCTNLKTYLGSEDAEGDFSSYVIPETVGTMYQTFYGCKYLTSAPEIPSSVTDLNKTFYNCTSLSGIIEINTDKITDVESDVATDGNGYQCFYGTTENIVLKGTGSNQTTLQLLASTANNGNVTIE